MKHPGVILPPPLLYLAALALVFVLRAGWPLPLLEHPAGSFAGYALVLLGIGLNAWGAYSMISARTPINPYRPVNRIVDNGAFRLTRNPLYVSFDLMFVGLALILNTAWGLLVLVPTLVVMHYGVIRREERYLGAIFGEAYDAYCRKVRRYL